ncbi:Glycosyltransferase [Alkalibacterium sp. AK22]|uniref:glycosyltransferase n=1 Tax=Alkalibacterium sp. AK22 TaxID=1229520 RepID=UPI00045229F6|nr:glycosyltransferase [Alkalibacterium sp. AK22]EXJ23345.1 Glycosyltransferase [Alkalibacterium sp. AK22]
MKQKIIQLIGHLQMGGAESLVTEYGMQIDRSAFELIVVTLEKEHHTSNEKKLKQADIRVIYLGDELLFPNSTRLLARLVHKMQRYYRWNKRVKKEQPHIIHSHLQTNEYLIPLPTKKRNIQLFHTLHNEVDVHFRKSQKVYRWSTRYCIKHKQMQLIALHHKMMDEAKELFDTDSVLVLHNGINSKRFEIPAFDSMDKKKQLNIPEETKVIGHIGRFTEQKNHLFLLDIFKECQRRHPLTHLLLIGSGEKRGEIERKIRHMQLNSHVTILENRADIPELMKVMDVFLFPSLFEGFPIVLLEAQAAGVRCVVSDKITSEVCITNLIQTCSLADSVDLWAEAVLTPQKTSNDTYRLDQFDISEIILELQKLYTSTASIHF